jgi:hypothetical protein
MLREALQPLDVEVILTYPGRPEGKCHNPTGYFLQRLKRPNRVEICK